MSFGLSSLACYEPVRYEPWASYSHHAWISLRMPVPRRGDPDRIDAPRLAKDTARSRAGLRVTWFTVNGSIDKGHYHPLPTLPVRAVS